jgi:hypothetical protein
MLGRIYLQILFFTFIQGTAFLNIKGILSVSFHIPAFIHAISFLSTLEQHSVYFALLIRVLFRDVNLVKCHVLKKTA